MARTQSLAALVAIGAALTLPAAAAEARKPPRERHDASRGLDSLNQPVVQRTDYLLDLADNGGLSDADIGRLHHWFDSLGVGYGDHVFVDHGTTAGRNDVAVVASTRGLLLSQGAPILEGDVPMGAVRVIVSRTTASVPNCPNYERDRGPSSTSSNYGCALNTNLAAMIADPNDLVLGQVGSVVTDPHTSSKAIRFYRQTQPTGTKGLTEVNTRGN
ncbi:MAG TPA: CpaD family pilus assembly lipoprotein [Allosphingosinicella sp.]|jgi:pilus assembly protein CpaD|nr:CpaD family pilus assembly lipoprotein [Allosphingosinicella sp.]